MCKGVESVSGNTLAKEGVMHLLPCVTADILSIYTSQSEHVTGILRHQVSRINYLVLHAMFVKSIIILHQMVQIVGFLLDALDSKSKKAVYQRLEGPACQTFVVLQKRFSDQETQLQAQ